MFRVTGLCAALLGAALSAGAAQAEPVDLLAIATDALALNPRYAAARAEYQAARELVPIAQGKLLPQVGLLGTADWTDQHIEGTYYGIPNVDRKDGYESYLYGAVLKQALFRADLFAGLSQAELRVQAAAYALEAAQDELLIDVAEAYFGVLAAQDALGSTRAELQALAEQVQMLSGRMEAGLATEADLKGAQALFELAQADELEAQNISLTTTARLESLTGKSYPQIKRLPENMQLLAPQPQDENAWVQRAEQHNALVLAQRAAAAAAKVDRVRASRLHWPKLDIDGGIFQLDNGGGLSGDRTERYDRIGVNLEVPIYSGGQVAAGVRQAEQLERRAQALLSDVTSKAVRDTRLAYLNSLSGLHRVNALKRAVEAAAAAEASARVGFEAGTRGSTDVLEALGQRYSAERNYAGARYKALINALRLKQQTGQLATADLALISRLLRAEAAEATAGSTEAAAPSAQP
jgi:outer membrane protein